MRQSSLFKVLRLPKNIIIINNKSNLIMITSYV